LCISCDKNLEEFLMLCFVLWASCYSFLSIKFYVCTWVGLLFVNIFTIEFPWHAKIHAHVIKFQGHKICYMAIINGRCNIFYVFEYINSKTWMNFLKLIKNMCRKCKCKHMKEICEYHHLIAHNKHNVICFR
jgi:hypothetical protein